MLPECGAPAAKSVFFSSQLQYAWPSYAQLCQFWSKEILREFFLEKISWLQTLSQLMVSLRFRLLCQFALTKVTRLPENPPACWGILRSPEPHPALAWKDCCPVRTPRPEQSPATT
jgi:hypothetical protein